MPGDREKALEEALRGHICGDCGWSYPNKVIYDCSSCHDIRAALAIPAPAESDEVRALREAAQTAEKDAQLWQAPFREGAEAMRKAVRALQDAWVVSAYLDGPSDHKVAVRILINDALKALDDHTPLPRSDQADLHFRAIRSLAARAAIAAQREVAPLPEIDAMSGKQLSGIDWPPDLSMERHTLPELVRFLWLGFYGNTSCIQKWRDEGHAAALQGEPAAFWCGERGHSIFCPQRHAAEIPTIPPTVAAPSGELPARPLKEAAQLGCGRSAYWAQTINVCRLQRGHAGEHRADTGVTWPSGEPAAQPPSAVPAATVCEHCGVAQRFHWGGAQTCPGLRRTTTWSPAPVVSVPREEK